MLVLWTSLLALLLNKHDVHPMLSRGLLENTCWVPLKVDVTSREVSTAQESFSPCINSRCLMICFTLERFTCCTKSQKLGSCFGTWCLKMKCVAWGNSINLPASIPGNWKQGWPGPWRHHLGCFRNGWKTLANGNATLTAKALTENN